jgi:gliding motility-associated-like protein
MKKITVVLLLLLLAIDVNAQSFTTVDAGPDQNIDCSTSNCVDLSADFLETGFSTSYAVSSIAYDPPTAFDAGIEIVINDDDTWSSVVDIPFNFCFFDDPYSQLVLGSNGLISFDTSLAGDFCQWNFNDPIPNPSVEPFAIYGVFHDLNNEVGIGGCTGGCGNFYYDIIGTAPGRIFVLSFDNMTHYNCVSDRSTHMIVLYETTNVIEVHIQDKPETCTSGLNLNALVGIQNIDGSVGYAPDNRNTGEWSATNEAWRFTPNGGINYIFEWLDNGVTVSNDPDFQVCPSSTTTYTAQVTYNNCDGTQVAVSDTVDVIVGSGIPGVDLGADVSLCGASSFDIISTTSGSNLTFEWQLDGVTIAGETDPNLTATASGTYTLLVTNDVGCSAQDTIIIALLDDVTVDLGVDFDICQGTSQVLTGTHNGGSAATFEWQLNGVTLAGETSDTILITGAGTYTLIVTVGSCIGQDEVIVTETLSMTMDLGPDQTSCTGSSVILTADSNIGTGGISYEWYLDGVLIVGETSQTIEVSTGGTYTVIGTSGSCSAQDDIIVTFAGASFTLNLMDIAACNGTEVILDATPNEAVTDPTYLWNTGEITAAITTSNFGDYTVTVTAEGCSITETVAFTEETNCVIPQVISPNGDNINDSFDLSFLDVENLQIFNRQGIVVFEKANYTNEWFGQSKNDGELPVGTYFYVITLRNEDPTLGKTVSQWIYLNREEN